MLLIDWLQAQPGPVSVSFSYIHQGQQIFFSAKAYEWRENYLQHPEFGVKEIELECGNGRLHLPRGLQATIGTDHVWVQLGGLRVVIRRPG